MKITNYRLKNGIRDSGFGIRDCKKLTYPKSEIRNPKSEIKKILLIGASGQIGKRLYKILSENYEVFGTYCKNKIENLIYLDITNKNEVKAIFFKIKPDIVILTSSLTNVNRCESEKRLARKINVLGTKNIVEEVRKYNSKLVFFSTDYIFDGKNGPYSEEAIPNPINYYGKTKLVGEEMVKSLPKYFLQSNKYNYLIIRTTGVFSYDKGTNFVLSVIDCLNKNKEIKVAEDQYANPILADNLVECVKELIDCDKNGVYNISGDTLISRYEFSLLIADIFSLDKKLIIGFSTNDLNQTAKRPLKGGLIIDRAKRELETKLLSAKDGLILMKTLAKQEILDNIHQGIDEYCSLFHKNLFKPGVSKIHTGGRVYDSSEIKAGCDTILNFWLTSGEKTKRFENEFSKYLKRKYSIIVNSGSSANLLAISSLKLKAGDEIITPASGFPTTINPIIQNNLIPVFIDIELGTYNPKPEDIERAISDKTRAIFITHTLGNPCSISKIQEIAKKHKFFLIEDCCDALGSKYDGKLVGEFGDISTFSFYPAHHMSCSKNTPIPYLDENWKWQLDKIEKIYKRYADKPDKIKILSFNKDNKVEWSIPSAILKHKLGSKKMIKIICQHGREVEVTEDHSVFVLDRDTAKIVPKFAKEIKKDDYIIATNNIPYPFEIKHIDILDYFKKKSAYKIPVPARISVNEELCRFIGYFIAEGSYQNGLVFSFNKNEKDLIQDVQHIAKLLFGLPAAITKIKNKAVNVEINSKNLEIVFREVFGIEGNSHNKRIPWLIYHCNENCIYSFIYGYTRGDGSISKTKNNTNRIDVTSASKELLNDFQYLLSRVGISASFYRRNISGKRKIGKIEFTGGENYSLCFSGYIYKNKSILKQNIKNRNNVSFQIPLLSKFREYICVNKNQKTISINRLKKYLLPNKELYSLLSGEISFLKIRTIKEISYDNNEYVYDISVPGKENFYGGFLGIFLHNTMGEGGCITTNDKDLAETIFSLRDWGRACVCQPCILTKNPNAHCPKRFKDEYDRRYLYTNIGYNLKAIEPQAGIGLVQLKKLSEFIRIRKRNFELLYQGLKEFEDIFILPKSLSLTVPSWFTFPITIKSPNIERKKLLLYLEENKIETRLLFAGNILKQPAYKDIKYRISGSLVNSDIVMKNTFFIGLYPGINEEMINYILDVFRKMKNYLNFSLPCNKN